VLLQNEIPYEITLAYLSHSYRFKKTSFFNPSPLPTKDQIQNFPWEQLDWLIVNQGEALDLLKIMGLPGDFIPSVQPDDRQKIDVVASARRILRNLHNHTSFSKRVSILCTLGALGVVALVPHLMDDRDNSIIYVPAANINPENVRDTTGAGDCFTGYFVAGLMDSEASAVISGGKYSLTQEGVMKVLGRCVTVSSTL
jgi:ribokinase